MTTTKLDADDFMMMDVHRPLTDEEIAQINPQALVDKSLGVEREDGEGAGVGEPHAEEPHQYRCEHCFGPLPCAEHANVEHLNNVTALDISPTAVLAGAHNSDLEYVIVVGMTKEGHEYFASSVADAAESVYTLQRGIWKLNKIVDGERSAIGDEPTQA